MTDANVAALPTQRSLPLSDEQCYEFATLQIAPNGADDWTAVGEIAAIMKEIKDLPLEEQAHELWVRWYDCCSQNTDLVMLRDLRTYLGLSTPTEPMPDEFRQFCQMVESGRPVYADAQYWAAHPRVTLSEPLKWSPSYQFYQSEIAFSGQVVNWVGKNLQLMGVLRNMRQVLCEYRGLNVDIPSLVWDMLDDTQRQGLLSLA